MHRIIQKHNLNKETKSFVANFSKSIYYSPLPSNPRTTTYLFANNQTQIKRERGTRNYKTIPHVPSHPKQQGVRD